MGNNTGKHNKTMDDLLAKAKTGTTHKTYREADKPLIVEDFVPLKEKSKAGRAKVASDDKKKARQVFYSDNDFSNIEKCADEIGMDAKAFMQMCINQKVKSMMKSEEE